jgi:2-phosphoglycerate kinase
VVKKEPNLMVHMSGVDIPDDYNIQEAWDKACRAFAHMAQADLTASPRLSVDEVLEEIRRKQDDDEEKHKKYRAAKDVISKTGNFIMVLGGIAAQGASMVSIYSDRGGDDGDDDDDVFAEIF